MLYHVASDGSTELPNNYFGSITTLDLFIYNHQYTDKISGDRSCIKYAIVIITVWLSLLYRFVETNFCRSFLNWNLRNRSLNLYVTLLKIVISHESLDNLNDYLTLLKFFFFYASPPTVISSCCRKRSRSIHCNRFFKYKQLDIMKTTYVIALLICAKS